MSSQFVPRITPAEALRFSGQNGEFLDSGHTAQEVADFCEAYFSSRYADSEPCFRHFCTMQTVFTAGRIQGIREERSRRKGTESGAASPTKGGTRKSGEDAGQCGHPCTLTRREKVKEAAEVLTDKQIRAVWKFIHCRFGIDDISVRTIGKEGAGGEET